MKETAETAASSSYLDCYLYIDNSKLATRLYDKWDDFNFPIVNFLLLSSNIPSAPDVSQLIRYTRACSNYQDFMERGKVLTTRLLSQGYQKTKLVATPKKFYRRQHDLVNPYMWQFPELFLMFLPMTSHKKTSKIPDIHFYLHFLRSYLWVWLAKLAYQVMLTIRGRLITPFILGSMSVGLNILIRHSSFVYRFMSLAYGLGTMTTTT